MKCWALKTRGWDFSRWILKDYWNEFVREKVVAVGWKIPQISINSANKAQIIAALRSHGPTKPGELKYITNTILKFRDDVAVGDKVLLCRGYAANLPQNVHLYGIAVITGLLEEDTSSNWWWYKRGAVIQEEFGPGGIEFPRVTLADILNKRSLLQTLQEIECDDLNQLLFHYK
ncbi:hypothetical protein ACFLTP_08700 [Chloroflexota bacterium]